AVLADVAAELAHEVTGAGVLPVDRVLHRLAGHPVPQHGGLALVGDADRHDVADAELRLVEGGLDDLADVAPDLLWVVLDPARPGEVLLVLLLADRDDARRRVEDEAPRRRRALIDRCDVALGHPRDVYQ